MDPVGATASIITLAILVKDISHVCKKYVQAIQDAPAILSRFRDEIEVLAILFDRLLVLQRTMQLQNVTSRQSRVLLELLRRTDLLTDYKRQLESLQLRLTRCELRNFKGRLLFPLKERQILDALNVVQRIQSILESALRLDDR